MIIWINKQTQGSTKWSENHYYIKLFTIILGMFTNVVAKWPGNAHDSFTFQDSLIYDKLNDELKDLEDGFLIGDSGYGCKPFIMTPYPHPSTQHQEAFNEALGKTRVKIEQSFGIFKRRFHLMHSEIRMDPVKVSQLIGACAVLHNIAILWNDMYDPGEAMLENDQPDVPPYDGPEDGLQIRDYICEHYFWMFHHIAVVLYMIWSSLKFFYCLRQSYLYHVYIPI